MAKTMMKGGSWKGVATVGAAVATGRFTPSMISSVSFGRLPNTCERQRKETARFCARSKTLVGMFTECRLCKGESTIDWSPLSYLMVSRLCISPTCVGNKTGRPWLVRGMRIATEVPEKIVKQATNEDDDGQEQGSIEVELEEEESVELPEELCDSLESAAWSVGLDGVNVTDVPVNACVLGIDPDSSGAIAVLRAASQEVLDVPCVKVQIGKTMRRRHDASSIVDLVNKINAPEGSVAYVEQAMPFPKDGKQGWYGCGFGYGMWVGILMALGFKVVPVRAQAWKSAMGISGRQYTKDDSRNVAMALFPDLGPQLKRKKIMVEQMLYSLQRSGRVYLRHAIKSLN